MSEVKRYEMMGKFETSEGKGFELINPKMVLEQDFDAQRLRADTAEANFNRCNGLYYECQKERDTLRSDLAAAEQRISELEAQCTHKDKGIEYRDALISSVRMSSRELLMAWVPSEWEAKRSDLMSAALNQKSEGESHE